MTNEKIYENVMGHKPNKEFGVKGSFSWDDIDALMNAVKNCSIPAVVGRSEQLVCDHSWMNTGMSVQGKSLVVCTKCRETKQTVY